MDHQDLALALAKMAGLDEDLVTPVLLGELERTFEGLVVIEADGDTAFDAETDADRSGLGFLHFRDQRFYSVKLGNATRDRLGAAGMGGAALSSTAGIAALVTAGTLSGWAGGAALAAIVLALIGRAKPFVASFGLDEATTLDLAWRRSRIDHGFRLVDLADIVADLDEVEAVYGNAGFSRAKLTNALAKLQALGMIVNAGTDRYQLIERIVVSGTHQLALWRE